MATNIRPTTHQAPDKTSIPIDRFLRWPDVQTLVGICRSHAHQLIAEGKFPSPIKLVDGGRASAWKESEIREWMEQRVKASRPSDPEAAHGAGHE